jgi:large subunit ribosomal protein L25
MSELTLSAALRDRRTTPRRVRAQGRIPAICYGPEKSELLLTLDVKEFQKVNRQGLHLISLDVVGGESRKVLVHEVQRHPIRRDVPLHIDLYAVSLEKPMRIEVPLVLTGSPIGIKMGGIFQQVRRVVLVECLPTAIPEKIVHDTTTLDVGGTIRVSNLQLPEGVRAVFTEDYTVANCQALAEATPAEAAAAAKAPEKKAAKK